MSSVTTSLVSTKILTVPNILSLVRLAAVPVCAIELGLGHIAAGLVLTGAVAASDFADGWLARRLGQVSRLGQLLDPLADRALIIALAVALLTRGVLPISAAGLLVARDIGVLAGAVVLERRGLQAPATLWLGKVATFDLLVAVPLLAVASTHVAPSLLGVVGDGLLWLGVVLYYITGLRYAAAALAQLRGEHVSAKAVAPRALVAAHVEVRSETGPEAPLGDGAERCSERS